MPLSRDNVNERKLKLIRRAQFRLKQSLERVDWEESELFPEIEALKSGKSVLGLSEGSAFEVVIDNANPNPAKARASRAKRIGRR
jgi:hypothetical protein